MSLNYYKTPIENFNTLLWGMLDTCDIYSDQSIQNYWFYLVNFYVCIHSFDLSHYKYKDIDGF